MGAIFYDDSAIANLLSMSSSWVRVQRHKRRHGKPHQLDIDPVMIGRCPRYRADDVEAWIARLSGEQTDCRQ